MIMPPNVIRVFCNPSEPSVSHSVSKKQLCAILHCSTLMLIEKCHAVFRLTTRLSSQERTSLNLGSTVVCLQRLIQSLYKRCPNPTHALSLQCTVPKKRECKHRSTLRHLPFQSTEVNHSPVVVAMNIFKGIYLET